MSFLGSWRRQCRHGCGGGARRPSGISVWHRFDEDIYPSDPPLPLHSSALFFPSHFYPSSNNTLKLGKSCHDVMRCRVADDLIRQPNKLCFMGFRDSLKDHAHRVGSKIQQKPKNSKGFKGDIRDATDWPFPEAALSQSPPADSQFRASPWALSSSSILFLANCGHAILGTDSQQAPPRSTDDAAAINGITPNDIDSSTPATNGDSRRSRQDIFSFSDSERRSSSSPSPTRPLAFAREHQQRDGISIGAVDLTIQFVGAKGLPRTDATGGGSDPYFKASLDGVIGYT